MTPVLSPEDAEHAGTHLAKLAAGQRTLPTAHVTKAPRLRRLGRRVWIWGVWVQEAIVRSWRFVWNPRRPLGRWWAHLRLWAPRETFNAWKLLLLLFAVLVGFATYWNFNHPPPELTRWLWSSTATPPWQRAAGAAVTGALFTGAVVGLLAAFWNDLFRCPWLGLRIRRRIRKSPSSVLHARLGERRVKLVPANDPLEIVPRVKLFDEVLQGILTRDRKGVQIVVGDPGSGKTTALVSLAQTLARIGVLPVVVPLRATQDVEDLVKLAREQLEEQMEPFVRASGETDLFWRWLCRRRRLAILVDDVDQIGPDGERGYVLRRSLEEAATRELPIVVTARPAGVPAGIAASSLELEALDEETAAECVERGVRRDPAFGSGAPVSRQTLKDWIGEGELAEVPFYLELLAHLVVAGRCRALPGPETHEIDRAHSGRYRRTADGGYRWNRLWVRFLLLDHFYEQAAAGRVRRWIGIEASERHSSLYALEGVALGTLVAAGMRANGEALRRRDGAGGPPEDDRRMPKRERLEDFIGSRDRELAQDGCEGKAGTGRRTSSSPQVEVGRRARVSAHEVVDTGERLRILDSSSKGELQFRHRIMQAYLAGRRLAALEHNSVGGARPGIVSAGESRQSAGFWIECLLERRHPEKLTAHMALSFAALAAQVEREAAREDGERAAWRGVEQRIQRGLLESARASLNQDGAPAPPRAGMGRLHSMLAGRRGEAVARQSQEADTVDSIDPRQAADPEQRTDPDDALVKLTTAAEVACATDCLADDQEGLLGAQEIVKKVRKASFATRWTKLGAIQAIAEMQTAQSWECIWEFARDRDYLVRHAASDALEANAFSAFDGLREEIGGLILRASLRSERGLKLTQPDAADDESREDDAADTTARGECPPDGDARGEWTEDDVLTLRALAWILPAIVSGLREDPTTHAQEAWRGRYAGDGHGGDRAGAGSGSTAARDAPPRSREPGQARFADYVRDARDALEQLVALGFQGGQRGLEDALALGFKGDAMRHAHDLKKPARSKRSHAHGGAGPERHSYAGPGWVAGNRRLVLEVCIERAESWYARLLLHQALALYTIAGGGRDEALDVFARLLHRGRERHPFTQRAARLARAATRRSRLGTSRWHAYVWDDEGPIAGRRQAVLNRVTSQLVADVTLLLDLKEGSPDDRRQPFGTMQQLPHCLSTSRDRAEILGKGCDDECGWGFCPYKQPPADEPSAYRGVTRAFCREQQRYARHHRPRWQRRINRRKLREFWIEMEKRART